MREIPLTPSIMESELGARAGGRAVGGSHTLGGASATEHSGNARMQKCTNATMQNAGIVHSWISCILHFCILGFHPPAIPSRGPPEVKSPSDVCLPFL